MEEIDRMFLNIVLRRNEAEVAYRVTDGQAAIIHLKRNTFNTLLVYNMLYMDMAKKNDNWWRDTFNEIYFSFWDPSYPKSQSWTRRELKLIDSLNLKGNAKILDIPCGQGRHSVELAKKGFQVTGVDYSSIALKTAKKWAKENKVSPIFIKQDMRSLKIKKRFDAIAMLGNSFGYFSDIDNKRVISNISRLLKPSGFFVIHQLNPIEILRQFGNKSSFEVPNGYVKMEDIFFDPINFVKESRWVVARSKNNKEVLNVRLRIYTFPEIYSLFSFYKLNIVKVYGSFDMKSYQFDSPAMIIIAKKMK